MENPRDRDACDERARDRALGVERLFAEYGCALETRKGQEREDRREPEAAESIDVRNERGPRVPVAPPRATIAIESATIAATERPSIVVIAREDVRAGRVPTWAQIASAPSATGNHASVMPT